MIIVSLRPMHPASEKPLPPSCPPANAPLRVVIVEDHLMFREIIHRVCVEEMKYAVAGEADSVRTGREAVFCVRPDIAILDLSFPDGSGFELADEIIEHMPETKVLLVSAHCGPYVAYYLERLRVHGFVDKQTQSVGMIKSALCALARDETYFSPSVMAARRALQSDPYAFSKLLSERETAIVALIARGATDLEIGQQLDISDRTVQTHRTNILRKLALPGTPKLMAFALDKGFTFLSKATVFKPAIQPHPGFATCGQDPGALSPPARSTYVSCRNTSSGG